MREEDEGTVRAEYGNRVAIAALAALDKSSSTFRVVHDGTNRCGLNQKLKPRDQVRSPSVAELATVMGLARQHPGAVFLLKGGRKPGAQALQGTEGRSCSTGLPGKELETLAQRSRHLSRVHGCLLVGQDDRCGFSGGAGINGGRLGLPALSLPTTSSGWLAAAVSSGI